MTSSYVTAAIAMLSDGEATTESEESEATSASWRFPVEAATIADSGACEGPSDSSSVLAGACEAVTSPSLPATTSADAPGEGSSGEE